MIAQIVGQLLKPTGLLAEVEAIAGQGGEAGAVVAAIFQAAQALDENGFRFLRPDVAENATHACSSLIPWPTDILVR